MDERFEDLSALNAARLRDKAAHCRRLALVALSGGIADELKSIAREYEVDADALELRAS